MDDKAVRDFDEDDVVGDCDRYGKVQIDGI